jgi:hypothetical protein
MNNAFDALGHTARNKNDNSADTVAKQAAALTLQSQLKANTAANTSQRQDQLQHLAHQQTLLHANQHQILDQLPALSFNASNAGQGQVCRSGGGHNHAPPCLHSSLYPSARHCTSLQSEFWRQRPWTQMRTRLHHASICRWSDITSRWWIHRRQSLCIYNSRRAGIHQPGTRWATTGHGATLFQFGEAVRQLERMLFLWFRHCGWAHEHFVPSPPPQGGSQCVLYASKHAAVHQRGL